MSTQELFSDLRLRVSYGVTGNTGIDPYQTRGSLSRTIYSFGGNAAFGYVPGSIANPDLRWESSATLNFGVDFGLMENIGETRNRGWEVNLITRNLTGGEFRWETTLNLFGNKEEIIDLYGTKADDVGNEWFIGQPLTVWYDYNKLRIWQLGEEDAAAVYAMDPGEI
jgi:hypothetical protein